MRLENYHARFYDSGLDIVKNCVIVLKAVDPKGNPGMPEAGNADLPEKLLQKGVKDIVHLAG